MLKKLALGALALTAAATTLPEAAEARHRYRSYDYGYYDPYPRGAYYDRGYYGRGYDRAYYDRGYYDRGYDGSYYDRRYHGRRHYRSRCGSGTTGAIVGGAAGALLGREIAGGSRYGYGYRYRRGGNGTVGAIVGGAAGALIGREIGRSC
jgi:hypothetical protein